MTGRHDREPAPGDERYEGVDASFLNEDTWANPLTGVDCPVCGATSPAGTVRCPRCNALLLTACPGSCASCGLRSCARKR